MAHGGVTHLEISVRDLQASVRFSATLVGWTIEDAPGMKGYGETCPRRADCVGT